MRHIFALLAVVCSLAANAGIYDLPSAKATQWLTGQQNSDGSWGGNQDLQAVYTSAAVQALARAYKTNAAYYAGVTWLENHDTSNVDLTARSSEALLNHGDTQAAALAYLQGSQNLFGGVYSGWGLSGYYNSSVVDTALALIASADLGNTTQIQAAINFLKSNQRTGTNDKGWTIGTSNNMSDPTVTALVIQALARYTGTDSTLPAVITNGLNTLQTLVGGASPVIQQAVAAQAAQDAGNTVLATSFLTQLLASQGSDGSWNSDPFVTAIATRAVASAAQPASQNTSVLIPDQALRQAINLALGRNSMDSLNKGLLAQLTSISAIGKGISDLTGLQYAVNLQSANFNGNNLTSVAPVSGLTQLTSLSWIGNPGNPDGPVQVPALPPLAQLILAIGLFGILTFFRRNQASC
ncbi:hypothetical protein ACH50O_23020 (plasmid) [Methylomonas sp. 2BW1-5-20]|uniref:prenyltransferase/squalene oxidase repeat-containing protein n=1 Tax=Methylomonas sp. 2BW1-5-20 TaxID=3376686 RepID=UPI004050F45B